MLLAERPVTVTKWRAGVPKFVVGRQRGVRDSTALAWIRARFGTPYRAFR